MSGFDAQNRNAIDDKYKCRRCSLILKEPVGLSCGCSERLCKSCVPLEQQGWENKIITQLHNLLFGIQF